MLVSASAPLLPAPFLSPKQALCVLKTMSGLSFSLNDPFVCPNGNPLQRSCLENPRDGGACWVPSMGSHRVGHD